MHILKCLQPGQDAGYALALWSGGEGKAGNGRGRNERGAGNAAV